MFLSFTQLKACYNSYYLQFLLSEDFSDEAYVNNLSEDIRMLQDMANGKLDEADSVRAWNILNRNIQRKDLGLLQQREELYQGMFSQLTEKMLDKVINEKGPTIDSLFASDSKLAPLKNLFADLLDVKVKNMPEEFAKDGALGKYLNKDNSIYINLDKIKKEYPNYRQEIRHIFLHELIHAKQEKAFDWAKEEVKKKDVTPEKKSLLKEYINTVEKSIYANRKYNFFMLLHKNTDFKAPKNKALAQKKKKLYTDYYNSAKEVDADNVAYALQAIIQDSFDSEIADYSDFAKKTIEQNENKGDNSSANFNFIRGFIQRRYGENKYSTRRIRDSINRKLYQSAYFQETEPEQQNIFPGNRAAKKIHKVKGGYLPAEKFIELFRNADASTIVHECAHWYLDELTRIAKYNEEVAQDLEAVRRFLKNEGEEYFCEVIIKSNKDRQGFYLHEVELTKKLTDVFKTANGSTSMSSKLIIAHKIAEFNPDIKKHEEKNLIMAHMMRIIDVVQEMVMIITTIVIMMKKIDVEAIQEMICMRIIDVVDIVLMMILRIEMIISDIIKKAIWVFQLNNFLRASFFGALFLYSPVHSCITVYNFNFKK